MSKFNIWQKSKLKYLYTHIKMLQGNICARDAKYEKPTSMFLKTDFKK